ncbi:unnamed protein product [Rhizoctonia solani]|uniref:Aromatic amino acid beta-eliminating lyase/threonine aldolase domain-containing protein n=1 Tax=Rhizoctonia solani TaxID=456999 RepID=A0A8H3BPG1_9AGAM|nr:unnamed protein product [Rhizoctonia solani]CAE6515035.1 unnamed protein product [Rhizoctonia solani]
MYTLARPSAMRFVKQIIPPRLRATTTLGRLIPKSPPLSAPKLSHSTLSMVNTVVHPSISQANALSAVDFRSDTVTSPTSLMLQAMISSAVGDDVYGEDETTANFEKHIADLLGHEAGLFVPSGTAGNQIAIRVHLTQPPHSVLCHARSHINQYEGNWRYSNFVSSYGSVDVKRGVVLSDDIHYAPTRVIALENTYGGTILPLKEVQRISEFARSKNIRIHCDGARLWNAVATGAGSLREHGAAFDSISLCLSKGIGAPVGSVLVGSKAFIDRARWIRKSIGGGMRQTGVIAGAARAALDEVFPKLAATHEIAQDIEKHLHSLGLKTVLPVETNMIFIDLEAAGLDNDWLVEEAKTAGIRLGYGGRIVVHHQISVEAVQKLKESLTRVMEKKTAGIYAEANQNGEAYGTLKRT